MWSFWIWVAKLLLVFGSFGLFGLPKTKKGVLERFESPIQETRHGLYKSQRTMNKPLGQLVTRDKRMGLRCYFSFHDQKSYLRQRVDGRPLNYSWSYELWSASVVFSKRDSGSWTKLIHIMGHNNRSRP